jgi:hypothetical protein
VQQDRDPVGLCSRLGRSFSSRLRRAWPRPLIPHSRFRRMPSRLRSRVHRTRRNDNSRSSLRPRHTISSLRNAPTEIPLQQNSMVLSRRNLQRIPPLRLSSHIDRLRRTRRALSTQPRPPTPTRIPPLHRNQRGTIILPHPLQPRVPIRLPRNLGVCRRSSPPKFRIIEDFTREVGESVPEGDEEAGDSVDYIGSITTTFSFLFHCFC